MRRALDFAFALAVLVAASPLLLVIALAVVIDSPGSPIYRGRRAGKNGKPFRMWKFRTMRNGAERLGPPVTGRNDPRVTRLGRLLRRTKLDELPQFVNVLLGDMTLVGPRPEAPELVALYTPGQLAALKVKPGVTGCVQLESGCEEESLPEEAPDGYYVSQLMPSKIEKDIEYLRTRTPASDAQIVLSTAAMILRGLCRR